MTVFAEFFNTAPKSVEVLKSLENEDLMHDDHGPVIIGRRDRKPNIPEDKNKK